MEVQYHDFDQIAIFAILTFRSALVIAYGIYHMIRKPKKMSVRRNQSKEENEQLNSFKENLFGNLKDSLIIIMELGSTYRVFYDSHNSVHIDDHTSG